MNTAHTRKAQDNKKKRSPHIVGVMQIRSRHITDPSSATRATGHNDCNQDAPTLHRSADAGSAAAHG
jgi:hypothetical protein